MSVRERLPNITSVQHVEDSGRVWATRKRAIVRREPNGRWEHVASFPFSWPRDVFSWSRPTARAARADKANLFVNKLGRALAIRGESVFRLEGNRLDPIGKIQGDCVLHRGIDEDTDGGVYFGEYFRNPQRQCVRIWHADPTLSKLTVAYEFAPGAVRHVHAVHRDPFEKEVFWVTTGDEQGECYLFRTDDRFRSFQVFGKGGQIWRAVSLLFTPEHVCWITDSHVEQNYACRMRRSDGELEVGQKVPCSGWYGTTTREGLHLFATTVEKGPAIQRNESTILASRDGFNWTEVAAFRKDAWRPVRLFKYGVLSFPSGEMSNDNVHISGEGLVGLDGASLLASF